MTTIDDIKHLVGDQLDDETIRKAAMAVESLPDFVPSEKPREKLAYCSLRDVVAFTERYA